MTDTSESSTRLGRKIQTLLEVKREAKRPWLFGMVILVFQSIFTKSQALSTFEAMNSAHLSMCQKDVRPSVQKRWRTTAFSSVSTGDSVIPSSYEMKYEPAFKPLQGHPAFFWVRASRGPFHWRQKTQSPSHIPIFEGRLLLRCLCNVGLPLQSKTGNHSHHEMIWGARNIPQAALLKLIILYTWVGCLRETLEVPKGSQATCSVWCGSRGGYGENVREIALISTWFWGTPSNFSFLGWHQCSFRLVTVLLGTLCSSIKQIEAPYMFDWENAIARTQCRGIGTQLAETGKSHGFSRVAPGTWGIFSSYGGDVHSKLEFVQWSQDTCLGMRDTSAM